MIKNLLKEFQTIEDYNLVKCSLDESSISYIINDDIIKYYEKCMTDDDFNVRQIVVTTEENQEVWVISPTDAYVNYIYVDGIETTISENGTVIISNVGEHYVDIKIDDSNLVNIPFLFISCENTKSFDLTNLDLRKVEDCYWTFGNCYNLETIKLGKYGYSDVLGSLFNTGYALESVYNGIVYVCESVKDKWGNINEIRLWDGRNVCATIEYYNCEE